VIEGGEEIKSRAVKADAWHHRSDADHLGPGVHRNLNRPAGWTWIRNGDDWEDALFSFGCGASVLKPVPVHRERHRRIGAADALPNDFI
jgi:divalent metal cation (Fe/Co/Zn/Cd) transporter